VLTFLNENRPRKRYLYLRYCIAILRGRKQGWKTVNQLPSAKIWASPNNPTGYLRKSCLRAFACEVGDQDLPEDLVEVGGFVDDESMNAWDEKHAPKELAVLTSNHFNKNNADRDEEVDNEEDDEDGRVFD
jgi:hypothetical protein